MIRNIVRSLGFGLGLAALATAAPLPVEECATIYLDKNFYDIGDIAVLALEGPPGLIVRLYVSPDPDPVVTSPYQPNTFGPVPVDGMMIVKAQEITCEMPDKWIQAGLFDPNTHELVCVSNQVFLDVNHEEGCGDEPGDETGGGQGCTPGYWKQKQHYDSWSSGLTPSTPFSDVFANAFPGKTLGKVLALKGGGLDALGRHTVAALLNAASGDVDYALSEADVIGMFDATWDGSAEDIEALKDVFAGFNEKGCPLN